MESKRSFGEFIQQKRREAGLTQRELADKLYITESAVSKWERGLSYPDITLINDICAVLCVSERELLTASVDVRTRTNEKLAARYTKLTRRFKLVQIVLYGLALLTSLIVNLAVQHTLSWFFIVLASVLSAASLTLLPAFLEKYRGSITLGGFTASLLLLLLVCNIYTGGGWFVLTAVAVLFGLCVVFSPFVVRGIYLPAHLANHKALLCLAADTIMLFLLLLVCNWFTGGGWFVPIALPQTAFGLVLPWGMLLVLRYANMNSFFKAGACLGLSAIMFYLANGVMSAIIDGTALRFSYAFDFSQWNIDTVNGNVNMLILIGLLCLAIAFIVTGIIVAVCKGEKLGNR